jgi:hypothetical protein
MNVDSQFIGMISLLVCCVCLAPGLTFDSIPHRYTLDGVPVPSVTGILKAMGLIDFSGIPESILEAARVRGTIVHQALHYLNEGDLDFEQFRIDFPNYVGYVEGWLSFVAQRNFLPILNEHRVASRRYQVAGTLDCLGLLDGQAVLLDFATGRPTDVCKWLQTAAYEVLAREWASDDPALASFFAAHAFVKRYAVALHRDGTFTLEAYPAPGDAREFLALVTAHQIVTKYRGDRVALVEFA